MRAPAARSPLSLGREADPSDPRWTFLLLLFCRRPSTLVGDPRGLLPKCSSRTCQHIEQVLQFLGVSSPPRTTSHSDWWWVTRSWWLVWSWCRGRSRSDKRYLYRHLHGLLTRRDCCPQARDWGSCSSQPGTFRWILGCNIPSSSIQITPTPDFIEDLPRLCFQVLFCSWYPWNSVLSLSFGRSLRHSCRK